MIKDALNDKIREYDPKNAVEQENVLQELMQLFVLASLIRAIKTKRSASNYRWIPAHPKDRPLILITSYITFPMTAARQDVARGRVAPGVADPRLGVRMVS